MNNIITIDCPISEDNKIYIDPSEWHLGAPVAAPLITEKHAVSKAVHITAHWNMLMDLAHKTVYKFRDNPRISFDDCFQEAFLAAWEAIDTYDPAYGAKMSTHIYTQVNYALKNYAKRNLSMFKGHPSHEAYVAYLECIDNLSVENMMAHGLSYRQAVEAIGFYVNNNIAIEEVYNSYDDGAYWQLEEVEHDAYPFDFAKYLNQKEADALRLEYGFDEDVVTVFPSRKAHEYARNNAIMKLQEAPGIEQYLDFLK